MSESCNREALKKFAQTIRRLDLDKRVAATKWLEGVIVGQILTTKERDDIVQASNDYVATVEEDEYVGAVNSLIEYLKKVQRNANRALKKKGRGSSRENISRANNPR